MNRQYFTELNGYLVKDKEAREDISELNTNMIKKLHIVENISELLSTNFSENETVKTRGYYSSGDGGHGTYKIVNDDTLTSDGGSVHDLDNGLKAVLIVEDGKLNILQFGAKNDNSEDCTNILNTMISLPYTSIFIPQGQYKVDGKVYLKSNMNIHGVFNSSNINISNTGQLHAGTQSTSYANIQLRDLTIRCNGDRSYSGYAIYFENCNLCKIINCLIRSDDGTARYNGVCFELTNNALHCYDNRIINNQFQRAALRFIKSTDNFITDNILWGNELLQTGALTLVQGCHNTTISNNHFAVAEEGALRLQDTTNQLRITNNYFDAKGIGINANTLSEAIISDNIFFHPQQAILITQLTMSTISNNTFRDCDIDNEGYDDINITSLQGGNSFIGNKHYRTSTYEHTNKAKAYNLPDANTNYPETVINMANVWFTNYYNAIDTTLETRNHYVNCYPLSLF